MDTYSSDYKDIPALNDGLRRKRNMVSLTLSGEEYTKYCIGLQLVGPLLNAYAASVVEWCKNDDVSHLYCLSRDGQIVKEVFDQLASYGWVFPPRTYLLTSRRALRNTEFSITGVIPDWIKEEMPMMSLEELLDCLNLDASDCKDSLHKHGLYFDDSNKLVDMNAADSWMQSKEFFNLYAQASRESLTAALTYFESQGLSTSVKPALCDVGWVGSLHTSFESIFASTNNTIKLWSYLIGLKVRSNSAQRIRGFLSPGNRLCKKYCFAEILELCLSADHGGVKNYSFENGHAVATYTSKYNQLALDWNIDILRKGVSDFTYLFNENKIAILDNESRIFLNSIENNWIRLLDKPTLNEAQVIGSWPMSRNVSHGNEVALAPNYTVGGAIFEGFIGNARNETLWRAGIASGSGKLTLVILRLGMSIRRKIERLLG